MKGTTLCLWDGRPVVIKAGCEPSCPDNIHPCLSRLNIFQKYLVLLYIMLYIWNMEIEYVINWKAQVKKGILSYIVLKILSTKEFYGYELISELKRSSQYEIAEGTLYPLLDRLKRDGLVTSNWIEQPTGLPRKYYYITKEGESTLAEMDEHWKAITTNINSIAGKKA